MSPRSLRIARPTNNISALTSFYTTNLDFQVLSSFENHAGFDGVILGLPNCAWHLEFTCQRGVTVGRAPTTEHLLVAYYPEKSEWEAAVQRMLDAGVESVRSENPYWDVSGKTFEDPDGYRVVLQNESGAYAGATGGS
jgi:hypothetical protein